MSEVTRSLLQRWGASLRRGADFDSWGQLVEAIDEYQILARHLQKEAQAQHNNSEFTEEQKKTIGKIATCLELRSAALQSTQSQEEFKLEDLKKLEPILKNILTYNKEFPFDVQPIPLRRILAPGEEENLEFEEDEEGGAGAGPPDSFSARVPGGHPYTAHALLYPAGPWNLWWCLLMERKTSPEPLPAVSRVPWLGLCQWINGVKGSSVSGPQNTCSEIH